MKVLKPQRISVLYRVIEHRRRYRLVVTAMLYVPFQDGKTVLPEQALWKDVGEHVAGGIIDTGEPKPRGEVLLSGHAFAPGYADGKTAKAVEVTLAVERSAEKKGTKLIDKRLIAVGRRFWDGSKPSEPEPFDSIPLADSHAFGGPNLPENPAGIGHEPTETDAGPVQLLPQLEDPKHPLTSPSHAVDPAGLDAVDQTLPQRMQFVGNYDGDWLQTLAPGPAADFDPSYYQRARTDQQLDGFFHGDERIVMAGVHPEKREVSSTLTPVVVKAFIWGRPTVGRKGSVRSNAADTPFVEPDTSTPLYRRETKLRLDTVHLLPALERAVMIFRGVFEVESDDGDEVVHLMVGAEDPSHAKTSDHYEQVLIERLNKDVAALASLKDQDLMPPVEAGWSSRIDVGPMAEITRMDHLALDNAERGRERQFERARAEVAERGLDPDDFFPASAQPDVERPPDPYDFAGLIAYSQKMSERMDDEQAKLKDAQSDAETDARAEFAANGWDWDAQKEQALQDAAKPPDFTADGFLGQMHQMAQLAADGGQPMPELELDLTDPAYEERLRKLEDLTQQGYRASAHLLGHPRAHDGNEHGVAVQQAKLHALLDSQDEMAAWQADFSGYDLSGANFDGADLRGVYLAGANLTGASFVGARLDDAVLAHANLTDAVLSKASLQRTNLGGADLTRTDLSLVDLSEGVLTKATLEETRFNGSTLTGLTFVETVAGTVDFSGATLNKSNFIKSDLRAATFAGAILAQCTLVESNFSGCDLSSADLSSTSLVTCDFSGASLKGAQLWRMVTALGTDLSGADLSGAQMNEATLQETNLKGANLSDANLVNANLRKTRLRGADLQRADARKALLIRADLREASLEGTNLAEALMSKADLRGANLSGSNLTRADLSRVQTDGKTRLANALSPDVRVHPLYEPPVGDPGQALPQKSETEQKTQLEALRGR